MIKPIHAWIIAISASSTIPIGIVSNVRMGLYLLHTRIVLYRSKCVEIMDHFNVLNVTMAINSKLGYANLLAVWNRKMAPIYANNAWLVTNSLNKGCAGLKIVRCSHSRIGHAIHAWADLVCWRGNARPAIVPCIRLLIKLHAYYVSKIIN